MSEASIQDCDDCIAPAEAFKAVGNETRLAILEALWQADEHPASFSDLRRAVGMRDSAQFNYHLGKLRGQFIRKTDDGYEFRHAGRAVIHAVLSGSFNEDPELDPFPVDGTCADCESGLVARYANETLRVTCTACGRFHSAYTFPPGGLEGRTNEEIAAAYDQRVRHLHCLAADGVCHECNGRMESTVAHDPDLPGLDVSVTHTCVRCQHSVVTSVGMVLLDHADVVTFYRDHDVDLNDRVFWDLEWCVTDRDTTVISDDPWEATVEITCDDERLVLHVDDDLLVVESYRECVQDADATRAGA